MFADSFPQLSMGASQVILWKRLWCLKLGNWRFYFCEERRMPYAVVSNIFSICIEILNAAVLRCSWRFQSAVRSAFPLISYGCCHMIRPYALLCRKHVSGLLFFSFPSPCLIAEKTKFLHLTLKGNEFQGGKPGNVTCF